MKTRAKSSIVKPRAYISSSPFSSLEPTSVSAALSDSCWKSAMDQEFSALLGNHTWELAPPTPNQPVINNKWIFRVKYNDDGSLDYYKARLVAKGFQQVPGIDYFDAFSPVVKPSTIHIIFTLTVTNSWPIQHVDVNNAFLNGDLHETVFMAQPEGYVDASKPDHVCRLRKALYGLK